MQTTKKWLTHGDGLFTLLHNNQQIGTMEIALGTYERRATVKLGDQQIVIKKTGFWKSNLEITDQHGQVIAAVYYEKWYTNSFVLEYGNRKYKLLVRNNPLAEWALQDNNEDLLAYGLSTQNGKACVKVTTASPQPNYLFDFILWYLFVPIAMEQSADDFTFLALIA